MPYESLTVVERETLLRDLEGMTGYLAGRLAALPEGLATLPATAAGSRRSIRAGISPIWSARDSGSGSDVC